MVRFRIAAVTRWEARPGDSPHPAGLPRGGVLVRIEAAGPSDASGAEAGVGEATPLPGFSPESPEGVEEALRVLAEEDWTVRLDPGAPHERLAGALRELASWPASVRAGLEAGVLDALGRWTGRPVWRILGGPFERRVPLAGLLGAVDPADAVAECGRLRARGVGTVKLKVGRPGAFERELAVGAALRARFGQGLELRLDANGAWDPQEAEERLEVWARAAAPTFVEQPVPVGATLGLGRLPVPWAADEALADPELREALLDDGGPDLLVLKPMVLGGALAALDVAGRGAARGIPPVVTHALSGPPGHAAACEVALALAVREPLACGLDRHPALERWRGGRVGRLGSAAVRPSAEPGLAAAAGRPPGPGDGGTPAGPRRSTDPARRSPR